MLPNEMVSQMRCDEIKFSKSIDINKPDVAKLSNGFAATKEREDVALTKEKKKSFFSFSGKELVWYNVIMFSLFHSYALYCFLTYPYIQRYPTLVFAWIYGFFGSIGITVGVHRLWTHRSFKAKTPFRILLLCLYCIAGQYSVYTWVRDHRVHHKFTDTDADPHNSKRGLFFSHIGWLMVRRHPDVIKKGRQIDMSDVLADPVVAFGEKYYQILKIFFCFMLPIFVPVYFWNEDWIYAIMAQWFMRHAIILNGTWTVNSLAHAFGRRPYDKSIAPTQNALVAFITAGEGWHNYHHVFPWDYKANELNSRFLNLSTHFIHVFAAIGWAYDLKQPSQDLIRKTIARKGDGTHPEIPMPSEKTEASM